MINIFYLLAIPIIKIILNLWHYLQCIYYFHNYQKYIKKQEWGFVESSKQIVDLFKSAGISDSIVTLIEPIGFGHIQSSHPEVFSNITVVRQDIVDIVMKDFHVAIGIYRSRILESINPLYWIEVIINLPRHSLEYIGISRESVVIKIAQIIYWAIALVIGFIYGIYKTEIDQSIKSWIGTQV